MKYRISAFCLFVLSPLFVFSQGAFSYDFELLNVNFEDGSEMWLDNGLDEYEDINEYESIGGGNYATAPVAYVAGNSFAVEAYFQTSCLETDLYIRGKHIRPDGAVLIFPAHAINSGSTGLIHYDFDEPEENGSTFFFPNDTVEYHDPFEITWQFSLDDSSNDADWIDIHTSANPVYVSGDFPDFNQSIDQIPFHTYFRLSCRAAEGMSTEDEIIAAVWGAFVTLEDFLRGDDDASLAYYGDWVDAPFWADDMIPSMELNGQCSAHSMAFLNCLKVHGIDQQDDYLWVNAELPLLGEHLGILVNNFQPNVTVDFAHWANNTPPSIPQGYTIEYVIIPNQNGNAYDFTSSVFEENFLYTELDDLSGVPGQNQDDPKSAFFNHQIVSLADGGGTQTFYDVPYGVTYDSLHHMNNNLFGYIFETSGDVNEISLDIDLNGNDTLELAVNVELWLIDTDPAGMELVPSPNNSF